MAGFGKEIYSPVRVVDFHRKGGTALAAIGSFAIGSFAIGHAVACEDIAVLSEDGRYTVLSGDDLAERDVGNLWWLGIRSVDPPVPGSTFALAALGVRFADPETGQLIIPPSRGNTGIILKELGRSLTSSSELVVGGTDEFAYSWWLATGPDARLVKWRATPEGARISLLDERAQELKHWDTADSSVGLGNVGCVHGDQQIIAGLTNRLVIKGNNASLEPLDRAARDGLRHSGVSLGCIGVLVQVDQSDQNRLRLSRIDLAKNRAGPEFMTERQGRWLMFSDGERLLKQETVAEKVEEGAYRHNPTNHVRVLDATNGAILVNADLPAAGDLSHLFCRGGSERVVLSAGNTIYLIDLNTIKAIASRQVPFKRFFVM